ncbi:MAG TPA: glycosyltransferase family 4 protein [Terriglobia bacterium]|nr:glycosyltransferase family 4 protein [Terriglobia bacterium]
MAWLMPSLVRGYYWQPGLREFAKLFPNSKVFTTLWPGYARGCEGTFQVRHLPGGRFVVLEKRPEGNDRGFLYAPPRIILELIRFRPQVVLAVAFTFWTLCAAVYKALFGCRLIILWGGNSPIATYESSRVRTLLRRLIARFVDAVLSNTQAGGDYMRDFLRISPAKVIVHPYGAPDPEVLSAESHEDQAVEQIPHPVFLCVARLIEGKGISALLDAGALVKEQTGREFSLVIVGGGPDRERLESYARQLGLGRYIHWAGNVNYSSLGAYYHQCDALVFPTYEDIWGWVTLEAMVFGKAVLCSKYAGSSEVVRHGENGFVFDPKNPGELASLMKRFIVDGGLAERFGRKSTEIMKHYTPQKVAEVIARLALGEGPGLDAGQSQSEAQAPLAL